MTFTLLQIWYETCDHRGMHLFIPTSREVIITCTIRFSFG